MSFPQFCTCHSHPQSFDSGSTPEAMAKREIELGSKTVTVTDHGSLAAVHKVYELGKKSGLTPVVGLEAYFRDDNCPILQKFGVAKTFYDLNSSKASERDKAVQFPNGSYQDYMNYQHLTLHFASEDAYLCAVRLLSKADERAEVYGTERKPLFDWNDLEELAAHNVTATSSCLVGMVTRHLIDHERIDIAGAYFDRLRSLFGNRFYVEIFPHVCDHNYVNGVFITTGTETLRYYPGKTLMVDGGEVIKADQLAADFARGKKRKALTSVKNYHTWEPFAEPQEIRSVVAKDGFFRNECRPWAKDGDLQLAANAYVMRMATKHNIPILIGDDSHFANPEDKIVQDVRLAQSGSLKFYASYHRMSSDEAYAYFSAKFGTTPVQFEGWVENSYQWAERFKNFKFDNSPKLPTKFFPQDTLKYTKEMILKHGRMPRDPKYMERLKAEIDLLHNNGTIDLLPYFALIEEIARVHSNNGILMGPGRGSAGGMLLSYLLGITHVDPLQYNLSMDRFLTKDRIKSGKLPDIDSDFVSRDLLVGYDTDIIEFEVEDGTKHTLPVDFKVETDQGLLTIEEAQTKGADIKQWW